MGSCTLLAVEGKTEPTFLNLGSNLGQDRTIIAGIINKNKAAAVQTIIEQVFYSLSKIHNNPPD